MRSLPLIAVVVGLLAGLPADARMYEWVNPASGRVQLSGEPPSWYRSEMPGPRVRVFEDGALVDDTSIVLSSEEDAALRELALAKVEEQRRLEALRQLEVAAAREAAAQDEAARQAAEEAEKARKRETAQQAQTAQAATETPAAATPALPETLDQATIDRLKALIGEFDRAAAGQ